MNDGSSSARRLFEGISVAVPLGGESIFSGAEPMNRGLAKLFNLYKHHELLGWIATVYLLASALASRPAWGENPLLLRNGLDVRIFSPQDILGMTHRDSSGRMIFELADGTSWRLIDDIADPEIANKGDGFFHPMNADWVVEALGSIDVSGERLDISMNVFLLPYPRAGFLASSMCGQNVFLSPGVYEVGRSSTSFIVTHEVGHLFQQRYAPVSGEQWTDYLTLRGLYLDPRYTDDSPHLNRPVEIFAEDFRYLFGGVDARYSGSIENSSIALPDDVPGLREFFVALAAPRQFVTAEPASPARFSLVSYPNPFNPSTTIRVAFDGSFSGVGREVDISIYRADGALVRDLYNGRTADASLSVTWDGRDARGREAPSGLYLCSVRSGGRSITGKLLLVK
jgi:hypothetical protein